MSYILQMSQQLDIFLKGAAVRLLLPYYKVVKLSD